VSIEKIRAEVRRVREEHVEGAIKELCRGCCNNMIWPCPTLRLAEKVLKLAEALEKIRGGAWDWPSELAKRVLAEVAGDDATRHEPDPDAGILGHSPEAWERGTRKFEDGR